MKHLHDTDEFREALSQIEADKLGYLSPTESSLSLTGKALAELLDIVPSTLTEAVQNKTRAKGYLVHNWAARNSNGRVLEYHVPLNIVKELKGRSPGGFESNSDRNNPGQIDMSEFLPEGGLAGNETNVHSPTSLLPEGQDYHKSVGLASAGYVMRNLLDTEKPQGKALTVAALVAGMAVGGRVAFESNSAGVAGGVIGLLIGLLYLESPFTERLRERNERLQDQQRTKRVFVPVQQDKPDTSESEPNIRSTNSNSSLITNLN